MSRRRRARRLLRLDVSFVLRGDSDHAAARRNNELVRSTAVGIVAVTTKVNSVARGDSAVLTVLTGGRAPHARRTLGARARRVGATILSMSDAQVGVLGALLDTLDSLYGVGDVGEVDEGAVPRRKIVVDTKNAIQGQDEDVLFLQEVNQLHLSVLPELPPELLVSPVLPVVSGPVAILDAGHGDVADVDVTSRTSVHGECESRREGTRVLAPADFEASVVEGKGLVRGDLVEGERSGGVDEGDELQWIVSIKVQENGAKTSQSVEVDDRKVGRRERGSYGSY